MQDKLNCYFLCKLQKKNPPFYTFACIAEEESQSFTFCQTRIRIIQSCKEKLFVWCVSLCVATPVPLSRSGSDITAAVLPSHNPPSHPSHPWPTSACNKTPNTRRRGGGALRFRLCEHTVLRMLLSNVKFI